MKPDSFLLFLELSAADIFVHKQIMVSNGPDGSRGAGVVLADVGRSHWST